LIAERYQRGREADRQRDRGRDGHERADGAVAPALFWIGGDRYGIRRWGGGAEGEDALDLAKGAIERTHGALSSVVVCSRR
jgi:hypothetical protein